MNRYWLIILSLLLSSCAITPVKFPSAENSHVYKDFLDGTYELAEPGFMGGGEYDAARMSIHSELIEEGKDLPTATIDAILAKPNGSDIAYYYLAWAAEQKGFHKAANTYYKKSLLLFDFNAAADSGSAAQAFSNSFKEQTASICGMESRGWNRVLFPCVDNMREKLVEGIERTDKKLH